MATCPDDCSLSFGAIVSRVVVDWRFGDSRMDKLYLELQIKKNLLLGLSGCEREDRMFLEDRIVEVDFRRGRRIPVKDSCNPCSGEPSFCNLIPG